MTFTAVTVATQCPPPSTQYGNNKMNVLQSHPFLSIDLCVLEYVLVQILPIIPINACHCV